MSKALVDEVKGKKSFPRYAKYKDSGVEWLGEIPEEWKVEKGKWLFKKMERPVRPSDNVVTAFRDGQVTLRSNRRTDGFTNAIQEHGYQGIRKGDLVIHAMDAFAGAIGVSESDGKSTPVYAACQSKGEYKVNSFYYAYLLRHMAHSGYIQALAKGIRERSTDFRYNDFAILRLPLPCGATQERITSFLDKKTAEIDAAIAKKERLIELLKEQRAILINRAVTKGLNPSAPMMDSDVPWIGEIPAHWKCLRGKYIFREIDERSVDGKEELLSVSHMTGVTPRSEKTIHMFMAEDYSGSKTCQNGDLVINTMWAWMGALGIAKQTGIVSPAYGVYRQIRNTFTPWFLEHLLKSPQYIAEYIRRSSGLHSSRLRLYPNMFLSMFIGFPTIEEQNEIEKELEVRTQNTEKAIKAIQSEIATLKEFKQTLIANAVTGKIKI